MLAAQEMQGVKASELVGAADALRKGIGAPRSPALEGEIAVPLAHATAVLNDAERDTLRSRGRMLDPIAAVASAESVVGVVGADRSGCEA